MARKQNAQLLQVSEASQVIDLVSLHGSTQAVNIEAHQLAEASKMHQIIWPHHWCTVTDVQILQIIPQSAK